MAISLRINGVLVTGVFGTSVISPLIIGGTTTTSDLTLQTTSGVGASGADMHFRVGNNGATEAMTILNSGFVGIGITVPSYPLHLATAVTTNSLIWAAQNGATEGVEIVHTGSSGGGYGIDNALVIGTTYFVSGTFRPLVFGTSNASRMTILASGNVGVGTTVPTAVLHLKAGTATTATAPFKFTSGTNLTTAEAGAMEYNGTNLFFTRAGTVREGVLTQSAVTTEVQVSDTTVTVNIGGTTYKLLARA